MAVVSASHGGCCRITMTSKLILFVLPAVVFAKMKIELHGNFDTSQDEMVVTFSGSDVSLISNTERRTFGVTDGNLKNSVSQELGKEPDNTYVHSPNFWGDMYEINKWTEVTRFVKPSNAEILKVDVKPQMVTQQVFENNGSVPVIYDIDISHLTEVIMSSKWTGSSKLTVNATVTYNFEVGLLQSGGVMSLSFTSPWGANTEMKQTVNTGSASSVQVSVAPNKKVTANFHVLTAKLKAAVGYVANIAGDVVGQYDGKYKGLEFFEMPVTKAMSIAGLPDHVTAREVIDITCITHSKVIISDKVDAIETKKVVV